MASLTPKQERFCEEYLVDMNATQAAIRAGYSAKTAGSQGGDLTQKPEIQTRLAELREIQSKRTGVTADRVINELATIAFADMDEYALIENGRLKVIDSSERKPGRSRAVKKLTQSQSDGADGGGSFSQGLELHDKLRALEMLGKHLKLFAERIEHSGPDGKPIPLLAAERSDAEIDARIAELVSKAKGSGQ